MSVEDGFHDELGFGAGNQHGWIDEEVASVKFLMSDDILNRNAADAFVNGVLEPVVRLCVHWIVIVGVEKSPVDVEAVRQQNFGTETGTGNALEFEAVRA